MPADDYEHVLSEIEAEASSALGNIRPYTDQHEDATEIVNILRELLGTVYGAQETLQLKAADEENTNV